MTIVENATLHPAKSYDLPVARSKMVRHWVTVVSTSPTPFSTATQPLFLSNAATPSSPPLSLLQSSWCDL